MSTTHVEVVRCDRCGGSIEPPQERTIGHLAYMVMRNRSGSMGSGMSLDLCESCTTEFLDWWKAGT